MLFGLETFLACFWFYFAGGGPFFCIALYLYILFFSKYWYLALVYLLWFYYDRNTPYKGGYRTLLFRYLPFITHLNGYFPSRIVKTVDLSPDKNYLFAYHPHGTVSSSGYFNFLNPRSDLKNLLPGLRPYYATTSFILNTPLFREFILGIGGVVCSKDSLEYVLNTEEKGKIVLLFVGGASEVYYSSPGTFRLILKKRKGFINLALTTGCPLVPVLGFGDNELFEPVEFSPKSFIYKLQRWLLKKLNFFLYIPKNIIPKSVELVSIVGKPMELPHILHPKKEEIDYYHSLYIEELIKLFNSHKNDYELYKDTELVIVE